MKEIDELNQRMDSNDEIVDSLVKKNTEMEKRQAKIEEHKENFKDIAPRVIALENKKNYPEVYIPDYSKEFQQIFEQIKECNNDSSKDAVTELFRKIYDRIDALHADINAVSRRYFDPKTKWLLIFCSILILLASVLTGTTMGFVLESYELKIKNSATNISTRDTVNRFSPNKTFKKHKMKAGRIKQFLGHTDKTE
jgi:chromosome segregation ATPase